MKNATLIGVDCAVSAGKTGIAHGRVAGGAVEIEGITVGERDSAKYIADLVSQRQSTLLALDAPLGWPAQLGTAVASHWAGRPLPGDANLLFRRETDRYIRRQIGRQPLDVGADRIARTAHAALGLLNGVRRETALEIPLAWDRTSIGSTACIEVYPAATLDALGVQSRGYKNQGTAHKDARAQIIHLLGDLLILKDREREQAINIDDALDAAICCLAAADFLRGIALEPEDMNTAEKEGWIWVRALQEPAAPGAA